MWLRSALEQLPGCGEYAAGEPTLVAMGHCLRKQGQYGQALEWYHRCEHVTCKGSSTEGSGQRTDCEPVFPLRICRALAVNPAQSSTHSAVGLTYQLIGDPFKAVEAFHSALALRPDDALATEMLGVAVADAAGEAHGWA